ncbi:MAG: serine/threonine protein kinase, partial [Oscillibacter sp.]|nr:serine/threonine protein kinase [Oscillibacter sp.]
MEDNSTLKIVPTNPEKPPDDNLPPGSLLNHGKYRVERVLGRGGFGVTYLALDQTLGLRVAVKECLPNSAAWRNSSGASVQWGLSPPEQEAALENFVKEARKMAKIDQIPGVVRVREYFYDNKTAYIVMDYVDGETLAQRLRRTGSMSAAECFALLSPVMDALALAHKRGLVHRDISPNNIMIESGGEKVWLLDLGAAKDMGKRAFASNVSNGTQIIGTPGYTPLEQYDPDGKIGPWTDIYALSATFFRCMTGQSPPPSTSRAMKDEIPELLRPAPGKVGAALRKGLAQNPEERYQSITELRGALEKALRAKPKFPKVALLLVI